MWFSFFFFNTILFLSDHVALAIILHLLPYFSEGYKQAKIYVSFSCCSTIFPTIFLALGAEKKPPSFLEEWPEREKDPWVIRDTHPCNTIKCYNQKRVIREPRDEAFVLQHTHGKVNICIFDYPECSMGWT